MQFELPSRRDVKKCVVTRETVEKGIPPTLVTEAVSRRRRAAPGRALVTVAPEDEEGEPDAKSA